MIKKNSKKENPIYLPEFFWACNTKHIYFFWPKLKWSYFANLTSNEKSTTLRKFFGFTIFTEKSAKKVIL